MVATNIVLFLINDFTYFFTKYIYNLNSSALFFGHKYVNSKPKKEEFNVVNVYM